MNENAVSTDENRSVKLTDCRVIDLGQVQDLTGHDIGGNIQDGSGSVRANRKDSYGGAGER